MDSRLRQWAPVGLGVTAGAAVVVQSRVNGALHARTHDGFVAATANFTGGIALLIIGILLTPMARQAVRALPARVRGGELRPWHLLGGLGGAAFIVCQSVSVPAIGVALFTVATVAGQSGSSLLVDRYGLGPGGRRPVTLPRLAAAVVAVLAVGLAVSGRVNVGHQVVFYVVLTIVAGLVTSVQQAFNGRVAAGGAGPPVAALANFATGLTALLVIVAVRTATGSPIMLPSPLRDPLLYAGGPLGLFFIVSAAWIVRRVGVLLFVLSAVAGQLGGALVADTFFPTPGSVVSWQVVAGVVLTGVAVAVAALRSD